MKPQNKSRRQDNWLYRAVLIMLNTGLAVVVLTGVLNLGRYMDRVDTLTTLTADMAEDIECVQTTVVRIETTLTNEGSLTRGQKQKVPRPSKGQR